MGTLVSREDFQFFSKWLPILTRLVERDVLISKNVPLRKPLCEHLCSKGRVD